MPRLCCTAFIMGLFFVACETPKDKISRLQRETLEALHAGDYFEIRTKSQIFQLPLPPDPDKATRIANRIFEINVKTHALADEKLNPEDKKRLNELNGQLATLIQYGKGAFFDPNECVLSNILLQNSDPGVFRILVQKIPAYYAEVERRWQPPSRLRAQKAAEQSLLVLDCLDKMGDEANPARMAVKDFIGMCQSAALAD